MNEPITGAGLVGASLVLIMGVQAATINSSGIYSVAPTNPVSQLSTSGVGLSATFNVHFATINLLQLSAPTGDTRFIPGTYNWALQLIFAGPPLFKKDLTTGTCVITKGIVQ